MSNEIVYARIGLLEHEINKIWTKYKPSHKSKKMFDDEKFDEVYNIIKDKLNINVLGKIYYSELSEFLVNILMKPDFSIKKSAHKTFNDNKKRYTYFRIKKSLIHKLNNDIKILYKKYNDTEFGIDIFDKSKLYTAWVINRKNYYKVLYKYKKNEVEDINGKLINQEYNGEPIYVNNGFKEFFTILFRGYERIKNIIYLNIQKEFYRLMLLEEKKITSYTEERLLNILNIAIKTVFSEVQNEIQKNS